MEKTSETRDQDPMASNRGDHDGQPIEVEVLLFAALREATGSAREVVTLPHFATAGSVLEVLVARYPALAAHTKSLRLAVNSEYAEAARPLRSGDQVALIPPTCGG